MTGTGIFKPIVGIKVKNYKGQYLSASKTGTRTFLNMTDIRQSQVK